MNRTLFALCLVALFALAVVLPSYAADMIGAGKCKMCHKKNDVFAKWEGSKHAKAVEALKSEAAKKIAPDAEKNEKCLGCHKVGSEEGVGCEACHGAGSDYKAMDVMKDKEKAKAAGLVIPTEDVCKKCHNDKSPTFKSFDFGAMKEKIKHWK